MEAREKEMKEFINELRQEWKLMWMSRFDDKVRAESVADKTYDRLFVERGMVLFATRKYRPLEFREILEKYMSAYEIDLISPNPVRGGVRKFIREYITPNNRPMSRNRRESFAKAEMVKRRQAKQSGRGWLHLSMRQT